MRVCKKCGETKALADFAPYTDGKKKGIRHTCRACAHKIRCPNGPATYDRRARPPWVWGWYAIRNETGSWLCSIRAYSPGDRKKRRSYFPSWSVSKSNALWYKQHNRAIHLLKYFRHRYPNHTYSIHKEGFLACRRHLPTSPHALR